VKLPDGWRAALDLLCDSAVPFDDSCFRSVELAWAHPDDVISGAGTRLKGGRFAPKGTRAVYASIDEDTATREVTARKTRLGGKAQIALKDYPRLTYTISINAKTCVDFRNIGNNAVLKDVLAAASDLDDLGPSQEVGAYLLDEGIEVVGGGANIAAFLTAIPCQSRDRESKGNSRGA